MGVREARAQDLISFRPAAPRELIEAVAYVGYVVLADTTDVIAVAHAKRRPGYWRRRPI